MLTPYNFRFRDVIGHMTDGLAVGNFLSVFHWYWHCVSKGFPDRAQMYLGHGLDLSRSRDVIGHVYNFRFRSSASGAVQSPTSTASTSVSSRSKAKAKANWTGNFPPASSGQVRSFVSADRCSTNAPAPSYG